MKTALPGPAWQAFGRRAEGGSAALKTVGAAMLGAWIAAAGGCGKVSEAAPGAAANQTSPPSGGGPAVPSIENANYKAQIRPSGACKKDQVCGTEVVVEAKGEYHINDKYPYKFKLDEPPQGMRYPKPVVGKEDGTMDEHKVVLKVPFVSETTGARKVSGTLSLSVCSAANCLMDKQPLEVTVKVE